MRDPEASVLHERESEFRPQISNHVSLYRSSINTTCTVRSCAKRLHEAAEEVVDVYV